jgi:kynurenine formamidase
MASNASPSLKHLASVPYSDPPSRLRTLDIWLPEGPVPASPPTGSPPGLWFIYLHGGAWHDPLQDASCIRPTLSHLSASHPHTLHRLAGIASLNYRLSPYAAHPTHPSAPDDADRSALHPSHVRDVVAGLRYLQQHHGMQRWIGVGHSCGATILSQLVAGLGLEEEEGGEQSVSNDSGGPEALVLLEGIYHIPLMLKNHMPPACPAHISDIYKAFVRDAFGHDDYDKYLAASPVSGKYNVQQWPQGRLLVICHSYEDELVERAQRDVMCVALDREGWSIVMEVGDEEDEVRAEGRRVLNVRDLKGGHDWIWEDGAQIAALVAEVVQRLDVK